MARQAQSKLNTEAWEAIVALDVERLERAIHNGAMLERERWIDEEPFAGVKLGAGLKLAPFDAWIHGISEALQRLSPLIMTEKGDDLVAKVKERATRVARMIERMGACLRSEDVGPHADPASASWLRDRRAADAAWWGSKNWKTIGLFSVEELTSLLAILIGEWAAEPVESGGLALADWRAAIAGVSSENQCFGFQMEEQVRARTARTLTAEQWGGLLAGRVWGDGEKAVSAIEGAVSEAKGISTWSASWLMCYAIRHNSIAIIGDVSERCEKMHWRAPREAWGWVDWRVGQRLDENPAEELPPLSLMQFALRIGVAGCARWPIVKILSQSAMVMAAEAENPCPETFKDWNFKSFERWAAAFPFIKSQARNGDGVGHVWARSIKGLAMGGKERLIVASIRETIAPLLNSSLSNLIAEENDAGETAASLIQEASALLPVAFDEWRDEFAKWESAEIARQSKAASRRESSKRM